MNNNVNIILTYSFNIFRITGIDMNKNRMLWSLFLIFIPGIILAITNIMEILHCNVDKAVDIINSTITDLQVSI